MVTLYENIKHLCEQRGVTVSRMCLDMGVSKSTMSDLKSGKKKSMTIPTLEKIATYLGTSVDEILNGTLQGNLDRELRGYRMGREAEKENPAAPKNDGLSDKEWALIKAFRAAPAGYQDSALALLESAAPVLQVLDADESTK